MSVYATANFSFLRFFFVATSTITHLVELGSLFFLFIAWDIAVHDVAGEVTYDIMGMSVDHGTSILIISLSTNVLLGGSFGVRWCGIFTIFLILKFCAVDFCHQFVYFGSEVLLF